MECSNKFVQPMVQPGTNPLRFLFIPGHIAVAKLAALIETARSKFHLLREFSGQGI